MRIPQDEKIVGTECRPGPALPFICCADTGEEDDDRHRLGNAESFDRSAGIVVDLIADLIRATGERLLQPLRTGCVKPVDAPILRYQNALWALIRCRVVIHDNPIHLPHRHERGSTSDFCLMDLLQLFPPVPIVHRRRLSRNNAVRFRFCWKAVERDAIASGISKPSARADGLPCRKVNMYAAATWSRLRNSCDSGYGASTVNRFELFVHNSPDFQRNTLIGTVVQLRASIIGIERIDAETIDGESDRFPAAGRTGNYDHFGTHSPWGKSTAEVAFRAWKHVGR